MGSDYFTKFGNLKWFVIIVFVACTILSLITVLGYPGQMSYDSFYALRESRTFVQGGSYPPMHAYVWRLFETIKSGPLLMWVFHNSILILSYLFVVSCLIKTRLVVVVGVCITFLWPAVFGSMLTVWKDVPTAAYLMSGFAIYLIVLKIKNGTVRNITIILALISLVLGMSMKLNAVVAGFPVLWLLLYRAVFKGREKAIVKSFIGSIIVVLPVIFISSYNLEKFQKFKPYNYLIAYPETYTLANDLIGMSYYTNKDIVLDDGNIFITAECVKEIYSGFGIQEMQPLVKNCKDISNQNYFKYFGKTQLLGPWLEYIASDPESYLKSKFFFMMSLIGMVDYPSYLVTQYHTPNSIQISLPSQSPLNPNAGEYWEADTATSEISSYARWYVMSADKYQLRVYVPYLFALLSVLILAIFHEFKIEFLALFISGFLYFASNALLVVEAGTRYNLWSVFCAFILIIKMFDVWVSIANSYRIKSKKVCDRC